MATHYRTGQSRSSADALADERSSRRYPFGFVTRDVRGGGAPAWCLIARSISPPSQEKL